MEKTVRFISFLLFCCYLFVGFRIYTQFGVPIDEYSQIDLGRVNYERITSGSREIQTHYDRHYGPAFEVPLYVISESIARKTGADVISIRHLGVFLFFAFSVLFFYFFLEYSFGHPGYGLLGSLLLVLYPRFFAESFYNTKDMAFVAITIISMYCFLLLQRKGVLPLVLFAVVTGISIAIRVQGVLLFVVYSIALLGWGQGKFSHRITKAGFFIMVAIVSTWASFPLFWNNVFENLVGFWRVSANSVGVATYYMGTFYTSPDIPWHYHFIWIGISGMLSVVVFSLMGIGKFGYRIVKNVQQTHMVPISVLGIISGTLITSVFLHPRSYDGWRHIYYVYPAMIYFVLYGVHPLRKAKKGIGQTLYHMGCIVLVIVDLLWASIFIFKNHPHQYVYFNMLSGDYRHAKAQFDFDYWGISLRELETYLMKANLSDKNTVYFDQMLPFSEKSMIPSLMKRGIRPVTSLEEADLYIAVFRDFKEPPPEELFEKLYAVSVGGADLSAVYARK